MHKPFLSERHKEVKLFMLNEDRCSRIEEDFEYDKTYYFDKSGIAIDESEVEALNVESLPVVEASCKIKLPDGFKFSSKHLKKCFDISNLECFKVPITQKITLSTAKKYPVECEPVVGYEIRAIGQMKISVCAPISPVGECAFLKNPYSCCDTTVFVNKAIGYSKRPYPCPTDIPCIDWCLAFFTVCKVEDCTGTYLQVKMGIALEYTGICDDDDE